MASAFVQQTALTTSTSCVICVICESPLFPEEVDANSKEEDVASLKCGHVFHSNCLNQWLRRRETCPNCRAEVSQDDIVAKLFFNTDEGQAAEFKQKQNQEEKTEDEKPWYEKYKDELLLGGGVLLGAVAGAVVTGLMGANKKRKN